MYLVFSLLALMIVVMTGLIPHTVPPHWQINEPVFIVPISFLVGGHLLAPLVSALLFLCLVLDPTMGILSVNLQFLHCLKLAVCHMHRS